MLNLSALRSYFTLFDTYSVGGAAVIPAHSQFLNNLLWTDPYGDGSSKAGDVAEGWTITDGGKVLTFTLRKGVKFHDGTPLTSKDVVYNLERARKPRAPTMTEFQGKLDAIDKVEAPDDSTVKVTLSRPSNAILFGLSSVQFLIYPSHIPMPEMNDQWRKTRIGSGPFKLVKEDGATMESVRNASYWKPGLPYLDGVTFHGIDDAGLIQAAYRTGKVDATSFDFQQIQPLLLNGTLQREVGFSTVKMVVGGQTIVWNNKDPFKDARVREAVDLALNRQDIMDLAFDGQGNPFAPPLLSPELGGLWGTSAEVMKSRPGYRPNKTEDIARAKQLLTQAGVDPATVKLKIVVTVVNQKEGEAVDANLRAIGFKPEVQGVDAATRGRVLQSGDFEIYLVNLAVRGDEPGDYLAPYVRTGAGSNFGKWSDPEVDRLLQEQDQSQDIAKRKDLLRQLEERVLNNRHIELIFWQTGSMGYNRFVKNYPTKLHFLFDPWYRWEQISVERG